MASNIPVSQQAVEEQPWYFVFLSIIIYEVAVKAIFKRLFYV